MMKVTDDRLAEIRTLASEMGMSERGYSGRGMYGAPARWAAESDDVRPGSEAGRLIQSAGVRCDEMGLGWVYYVP